jgi:hypothetical protein
MRMVGNEGCACYHLLLPRFGGQPAQVAPRGVLRSGRAGAGLTRAHAKGVTGVQKRTQCGGRAGAHFIIRAFFDFWAQTRTIAACRERWQPLRRVRRRRRQGRRLAVEVLGHLMVEAWMSGMLAM